MWSRRKKRERIAREARADRSMEAKFSRRLHRLCIDGRPITYDSHCLEYIIKRRSKVSLPSLRSRSMATSHGWKRRKQKQATGNFIFSYPHLLVILLFVLPLIINLFSCSVLLISVSSRFTVSSPMVRTRSPKPVRKASTGHTVG